jgi:hypothetical protein
MLPQKGFWSGCRQTSCGSRRRVETTVPYRWVGLALAVALSLCDANLLAQTSPASQILEFEHDGRDVKGFVVYATRREDGTERRIDVGLPPRSGSGRFRLSVPALARGTWRVELAAYNDAGEGPRAPADPSELKIESPPSMGPAPPGKPPKAEPENTRPAKEQKKGGALRKLWRIIVGDDGPPPQSPKP